jgi:hypothetical protein
MTSEKQHQLRVTLLRYGGWKDLSVSSGVLYGTHPESGMLEAAPDPTRNLEDVRACELRLRGPLEDLRGDAFVLRRWKQYETALSVRFGVCADAEQRATVLAWIIHKFKQEDA